MSKVTIKFVMESLNPQIPLPRASEWANQDGLVYANYREEVLKPLASLYYSETIYANTTNKTTTYSFANNEIAMEYFTRRGQANTATSIALKDLMKQRINEGVIAPFNLSIILTDQDGNETILK